MRNWKLVGALKDRGFVCGLCKAEIKAGDQYYCFKERARSSHEAIHGGLMVTRRHCTKCTHDAIRNSLTENDNESPNDNL